MIRDQTFRLQLFCNAIHACSLHAHHLSQKFLREEQFGADEIVHPDEPLTHTLFHTVKSVASRGLLDLTEEKLFVLDEQREEVGRRLRHRSEVTSAYTLATPGT
jgi:hypothetical protein